MPDIRDITSPTEFIPEPSTPWWVWALVGLGVVVTIAAVIFAIRKNKPKHQRRSLLDKARSQLSQLKSDSQDLTAETIATRTSVILRQYFEAAFEDPALFETNEEFTLRPDALKALHPDCRNKISDHLLQLSNLKYEPSHDPKTANKKAQNLVDDASEILAHIELHP